VTLQYVNWQCNCATLERPIATEARCVIKTQLAFFIANYMTAIQLWFFQFSLFMYLFRYIFVNWGSAWEIIWNMNRIGYIFQEVLQQKQPILTITREVH